MINYIVASVMFVCGIVNLINVNRAIENNNLGITLLAFFASLFCFSMLGWNIYIIQGG